MRRQYVGLNGENRDNRFAQMGIGEHMMLYQTHLEAFRGGMEGLLI